MILTRLQRFVLLGAILLVALVVVSDPPTLRAQIAVPFTFTAGTVIDPDQMNTNFSALGNSALNRTGGGMTGPLTVTAGSLAAPGLAAATQTNTGFMLGTNSIRAVVNGVERQAWTPTGADITGTLNVSGAMNVTGGNLTVTSGALVVGGAAIANSSGLIDASRLTGTASAINGNAITNLNASNLATGTVPLGRLGAGGTANNATFLRGDNTWAFPIFLYGANFVTANYSALIQDNVVLGSGNITVTLYGCTGTPSNSGRWLVVKNYGTGTVTVAAAGGEVIDEFPTQPLSVKYQSFTLVCVGGSGWWII